MRQRQTAPRQLRRVAVPNLRSASTVHRPLALRHLRILRRVPQSPRQRLHLVSRQRRPLRDTQSHQWRQFDRVSKPQTHLLR